MSGQASHSRPGQLIGRDAVCLSGALGERLISPVIETFLRAVLNLVAIAR